MMVAETVMNDWANLESWDGAYLDAELEICWLRAKFDIENLKEWVVDYIPGGRRTLGRYNIDGLKIVFDADEMMDALKKARDAELEAKHKSKARN
jgi:hypothetical protein